MSEPGIAHGRTEGEPPYEQTGFRFGWAAAVAGLAVAVASMLVFSLLGIAIGFSWWEPGSVASVGVAAGVWMLVSWMVALFIGALVTGRLAGVLTRGDGALHGLVIWAGAAIVAGAMMVSGAGFLAGTAFDLLGRTVAATASAAVGGVTELASGGVSGVSDIDYGQLQGEIERILRETEEPALHPDTLAAQGEQVRERVTGPEETSRVAGEVASMIEGAAGQVDREAITSAIARETDLSEREAENLATRVEDLTTQARREIGVAMDTVGAEAERLATNAAGAVGSAAWWSLLALALGGGAAVIGGATTARD